MISNVTKGMGAPRLLVVTGSDKDKTSFTEGEGVGWIQGLLVHESRGMM